MKPLKDMTGLTFGEWFVIRRGPNTKQGQAQWVCKCKKCKRLKIVKGSHLRQGRSTQCKMCHDTTFNKRHGMYNSTEYQIWEAMCHRCYNPNNANYNRYGGRGINVCDSWRDDFVNFWSDMGNRPKDLTLERIDNDGNYCKENCKWASRQEQLSNTRTSHRPGNIYGCWKLLENTPYSKKSIFVCTKCGTKRVCETAYITSGRAASCKCS